MREMVLNRNRIDRQRIISESRKIFDEVEDKSSIQEKTGTMEEETEEKQDKIEEKKKYNKFSGMIYAKKFQIFCWLVNIPHNFKEFLVAVKPAGKRVLVFINNRRAVIRDKVGQTVLAVDTQFVGKSAMTTILDGVYDEQTKNVYVLDLIQWKGTYFTAESALFRLKWLQTNAIASTSSKISFVLIKYFQNTYQNLLQLYEYPVPYQKQGFMFVHPQSPYLHRCNQNSLLWKDSRVSEFPIDTEDDGVTVSQNVRGTALIQKDGGLYTCDGYKIWQFSNEQMLNTLKNQCIRFEFQSIHIVSPNEMEVEGEHKQAVIQLVGFKVISTMKYKRHIADPLSRLIYQYRARHNPIRIEEMLERLR